MKKLFKLVLVTALSLSLFACAKSNNLEKVVNKKYQGYKQHQI